MTNHGFLPSILMLHSGPLLWFSMCSHLSYVAIL